MDDLRELLSTEGEVEGLRWDDAPGDLENPEDVFDGEQLPRLLQPNPDYEDSLLPDLLEPGLFEEELKSETREPPAFTSNPYLLFGPRIVVQPNGLITKVYPLPPGKGQKMLELMQVLSPFPVIGYDSPAAMPIDAVQSPDTVEVVVLAEWDQEPYQNLLQHPPPDPKQVKISDWLVATATEELLWEVESFVKLFAAGVPQIEIEAKIVEVTETDSLDYGIKPSASGVPTYENTDGDTLIDSFTADFPNSVDAPEALLGLSTIQNGYRVSAIIEAVKNWENVSIKSQPKIAVREGGVASIVNTTDIPFYGFSGITATGGFQASLQIKEVGVKLYVVPRVVADTVALDIHLEASQQVGTLVSFITEDQGELATPIIARRQANTVVYLEPGQAVVLGGLTSERTVQEESKVPILGDIPLLGLLFKSRYSRVERTHVLFFIRPRILQAAELRSEF